MSKGFVFSVLLALTSFALAGYLGHLLTISPATSAAESMRIPLMLMVLLFLCIGLIFCGMAALWKRRLIEPVSSGAGGFRFVRAEDRSSIEFSALRLIKLIGDDSESLTTIKYAIVKLDGQYWLVQGLDSQPGILPWLSGRPY